MISRRRLLAALPAVLAGGVFAQHGAALRRIGVLSLVARDADPRLDEFERALAALGHVEGKSILIDWLHTDDHPERLPTLVSDLLERRAEVIVATMTGAIETARRHTSTVPIVFVAAQDPVGMGYARSLARPGFNMTGVASNSANIAPRQLELVAAVLPNARRIGVVLNPRNRATPQLRSRYEEAAAKLGLDLVVIQAGTGQSLLGSVGAARSNRVQALVVQSDGIFFQNRAGLVQALAAQKMPALFTQVEHVEAGGLMSYGPDLAESYRRGAHYVDRLLKGAKAAELPIEQPAKLDLTINARTAAAFGLTLPATLLERANRTLR